MERSSHLLVEAIGRSLRFELAGADVTRIAPGHTTGWRTLPGCTTAHVVGVELLIERPSARALRIRSGECVVLAPGERHSSTVVTGTGVSRWTLFSCWILGSIDLMSLFALPTVLRGHAARRVGDLAAGIADARRSPGGSVHHAVRMQALALRLVDALIADAPLRPQSEALLLHADRLAPVLDHIERRLATPLPRAALAKLAGLSPSRFHALFRAAMGVAPRAYVLRRRLQRAQQLLISTDLSVAAVAARIGCDDAFYFSRLFRLRCGTTPSDYRATARCGFGAEREH